jgi:hypothetical protein
MTVLGGMFERLSATSPPEEPQPNTEIQTEIRDTPTVPRHSHWRVVRDGKVLCSMIGEPMTEAQALQEVRYRWPSAEVMRPEHSGDLPLTAGNESTSTRLHP